LKYLRRFTKVHDELAGVGFTISEDDLESISLLGLPKSWHNYQYSLNRREKLLN